MNQKNQGYDEDWLCSMYNVFVKFILIEKDCDKFWY